MKYSSSHTRKSLTVRSNHFWRSSTQVEWAFYTIIESLLIGKALFHQQVKLCRSYCLMPWSNYVIKSVHHIQQSSLFQNHHQESEVFRTVTMMRVKRSKQGKDSGLNHIDKEESCLEKRRLMMVAVNLMPI